MDIRTYRAPTLQEALALVRRDLGPSAAVLHTREVNGGSLLRWIPGMRKFEVTASPNVNVPSRLPAREAAPPPPSAVARPVEPPAEHERRKQAFRDEMRGQLNELQSLVEQLCRRTRVGTHQELPDSLFRLYTDLMNVEFSEELARELVERIRVQSMSDDLADEAMLKARVVRMLESEIVCRGPIALTPGKCQLVALVGPTGVGKTTTIAKLAANYRLREKRRVGLITVDTYRIAAVEQLRTYADIIDLPMSVVTTPREMRDAVRGMSHLDLVLLDTAGRSPRDDVKIQELKSFVAEAEADEVLLVLSAVTSTNTLVRTAESFAEVGTNGLIVTKLDEASNLGNLLPLLRSCRLPLSYLTNGQNVPDDIAVAESNALARSVLGDEPTAIRK